MDCFPIFQSGPSSVSQRRKFFSLSGIPCVCVCVCVKCWPIDQSPYYIRRRKKVLKQGQALCVCVCACVRVCMYACVHASVHVCVKCWPNLSLYCIRRLNQGQRTVFQFLVNMCAVISLGTVTYFNIVWPSFLGTLVHLHAVLDILELREIVWVDRLARQNNHPKWLATWKI